MADLAALTMPKLGLAMTEGQVASWHREEGDTIAAGEEIADIETPKITAAYESPATGTLRRKVVSPGQTVPVGALIGVLAEPTAADTEIDAFIAEWQARFAAEAAEEGPAAPEPERIETPFGAIQILESGPAEGEPLVLIHGFGGDLLTFFLLQPLLAERYRTLALDLPGHGGSTKTLPGADPAALAAIVSAVMTARGMPVAHLLGHSLGGAIALALTEAEPVRVSALTLVSPAGLGPEINGDYIAGFIAARRPRELTALLAILFAGGQSLITREMIDGVLRYKRLDGVTAALTAIAAANMPEGRQAKSFRHVLMDPARPAQIVWGRQDQIIPATHAEGLPLHVRVNIFEDAGHMAHMEKAADLARLLGS
ncbi:MAG TPA: acetoin dehydrogenase dihydrolipoyllysine-residue acetyltransferase subunit [Acetobacteraceae bacterium]|nr:acetoin dehydrogenase dihydrolipoyllysine-residue acetyltransferase subunit [Acetobacteraceae bacterium]